MGYKFKPNKSVARRFKLTATGKLKRHHSKTSHLMSARTSQKKRMLGRPAILFEGHARNMRRLMGVDKIHPAKIRHERQLKAQKAPQAAADATKAPPAA